MDIKDTKTHGKDLKRNSLTHKRVFILSLTIVSAIVLSTISTVASANTSGKQATKPAAPVGFKAAPNPTSNPGYTLGCPAPTYNIVLLLDRSYSIYNNAPSNDRFRDIDSVKAAVHGILVSMGNRARAEGGHANVFIHAFATYSAWQNGGNWNSNYLSLMDLSDPVNVYVQADMVNDIWFTGGSDPDLYNPYYPSTAPRGYAAGISQVPTTYGATNWHQALLAAAATISFWTEGTNPPANGDFDLVVMITDGVPTANSGYDNAPGTGDDPAIGSTVVADAQDLERAQGTVTKLRTGAAFAGYGADARPPVNVYGVMVGGSANDPVARDYMTTVFGANTYFESNWYSAGSFTSDLNTHLNYLMAGLDCPSPPVPATASIQLTPGSNVTVEEGNSASIEFTVRNTSTNSIPLIYIEYKINDGAWTRITCGEGAGDILYAGTQCTTTYNLGTMSFGSASPKNYSVSIRGTAYYDPNTYTVSNPNPTDGPDNMTVTLTRVSLPS